MSLQWGQLRLLLKTWVQFHPIFGRIGGGATEGLMLSALFGWDGKGRLADGSIYKSQREWEDETCMTRGQIERARESLVARGLIEAEARGMPRTWHYRIRKDALMAAIESTLSEADLAQFADGVQTGKSSRKSSLQAGSKLVRRRTANQFADGVQTGLQAGCKLNKDTASDTTKRTTNNSGDTPHPDVVALSNRREDEQPDPHLFDDEWDDNGGDHSRVEMLCKTPEGRRYVKAVRDHVEEMTTRQFAREAEAAIDNANFEEQQDMAANATVSNFRLAERIYRRRKTDGS